MEYIYWAMDTDDVRHSLTQSFTLLTEALEIFVKEGIEGDATVKFPSPVSDITLTYH